MGFPEILEQPMMNSVLHVPLFMEGSCASTGLMAFCGSHKTGLGFKASGLEEPPTILYRDCFYRVGDCVGMCRIYAQALRLRASGL